MANTLVKSYDIASVAIPLLGRVSVLPQTVMRNPGTDFSGTSGDTITVRVRGSRTANVQTTPGTAITLDDISETGVPLKIFHVYSGTVLTDEDLTLGIKEFGAQVVLPAARALAKAAEGYIGDALNSVTTTTTVPATPAATDWAAALKDCGELLDTQDVEDGNRYAAVSPSVARALLDYEPIERADASGSPAAIRDAVIGRYAGFNIVKSAAITTDTFVAYHKSAAVFANRAPALPAGAVDAAVRNEDGFALRAVRDFDASKLAEISALSTFAGAAIADHNRAVRVTVSA